MTQLMSNIAELLIDVLTRLGGASQEKSAARIFCALLILAGFIRLSPRSNYDHSAILPDQFAASVHPGSSEAFHQRLNTPWRSFAVARGGA